MIEAASRCGNKKIVLDVGSDSGISLDNLANDRGVSSLFIEPDKDKCAQLRRRAEVSKVWTHTMYVLANVRGLKSGSQTNMVLGCTLGRTLSDEQLMTFIYVEIGAPTATFGTHFVVVDLYDLSTYRSIPIVCCFYPYDNVGLCCRC